MAFAVGLRIPHSTNDYFQLYNAAKHFHDMATKAGVKSRLKSRKPVVKTELPKFDDDKKRLLREKLLKEDKGAQNQRFHIFKQLFPWKTKAELADELRESEVYNKNGLIALCKPYGIAQEKVGKKLTGVQTLAWGGVPAGVPSLAQVLPILQEHYKVKHLEIIRSAERWNSGLLLLSTDTNMTKRVRKCLRRSKASMNPYLGFLAITDGQPHPAEGTLKRAITLSYVSDVGNLPEIKTIYSKGEMRRQEVRESVVEYSTVAHNPHTKASLVEINLQIQKWHFLRVWLSSALSPVLGDPLYGSRVKMIAGKRISISPHNANAYLPQEISSKIYEQLELPENVPEAVPLLIHLGNIRLTGFCKDKSDLVIRAPPPAHFTWTCEKLDLMASNKLHSLHQELEHQS